MGAIWCMYSVDARPEDRRTGYLGWKESEVTADGCGPGIECVFWMLIFSARSFIFFPGAGASLDRELASCKNRASGRVDISSSSADNEESELPEDLLRRFVGLEDCCAHSGTGCNTSNCLLNRLEYSFPLTISSDSFTRSFRSRVCPASETFNRSSSLSSHAGASPSSVSSASSKGTSAFESPFGATES